MTDRVNIRDADALERFAGRLGAFEASIQVARNSVESDIKRTLDYLGERHQLWKRRYEAWQAEARRLWSELERCAGNRLDRRSGRVEFPRKCSGIYDQYVEAVRREQEALINMGVCSSLIDNVQNAAASFRQQARSIEQTIASDVNSSKVSLKSRAAKARSLAAHRYSGPALLQAHAVAGAISAMSPLGGTEAAPVAKWTVVVDASDVGRPPAPEGIHEPDPSEGTGKEGEPDPEGLEGPVRLPTIPREGLEPPAGWTPGGERK